jgi:hypothetical protein
MPRKEMKESDFIGEKFIKKAEIRKTALKSSVLGAEGMSYRQPQKPKGIYHPPEHLFGPSVQLDKNLKAFGVDYARAVSLCAKSN